MRSGGVIDLRVAALRTQHTCIRARSRTKMSASTSSSGKRRAEENGILISDHGVKRQKLQTRAQQVLSVKDVCDLVQYITLGRSHNLRKPSWYSLGGESVSRVNLMILDGLTQSHFYSHFGLFTHLSRKYSSRWTLAPSSGERLTSELFNSEVSNASHKLPVRLWWHPVICRFGLKMTGMRGFLLNEQEMIKHQFPVRGGRDCEGFVCTESDGSVSDSSPLFGLDCEMVCIRALIGRSNECVMLDWMNDVSVCPVIGCRECVTRAGPEVTRVALVDSTGECLLDELVKPHNPILNYCTRFSGITPAILDPVTTRLAEVQTRLLELLPRDAVLVGHSLDSDLRALHIVHPHILDTSLLYRREHGRRFKLKHLAQVVLGRQIQCEVREGHDPCEDARAALHLAQYFISKGPQKVLMFQFNCSRTQMLDDHGSDLWELTVEELEAEFDQEKNTKNSSVLFGDVHFKSCKSAVFVGRSSETIDRLVTQQCRRHTCSSDRQVLSVFRKVAASYSLSLLLFSSFSSVGAQHDHLQQVCERLEQMCVLYVGPLPPDVSEGQVHALLRRCGRLRSVRMLHFTHRVHARVVFDFPEGALMALERQGTLRLDGCTVKVRRPLHDSSLDLDERLSERQSDPINDRIIYVCNLSRKPQRRQTQLQSFVQHGRIQHVWSSAEHAGRCSRHAFIEFERADSTQAALQDPNRKQTLCHALTPPHMSLWTHPLSVTIESTEQHKQECDRQLLERKIRKLDRRVGKVFRTLEKHCLSIVILPGAKIDGAEHPGMCFIQMKPA
ncbi:hypothetical protein DNTS_030237 [Danionella cerebrum]|uniref:RRM domain-containing protein n=1 Tax=Danionella cerebrum TaxID=2873325 RepID=A0A553Q8F6_9TELE|nr:hypothetical protein DNTS_030237 [Danionella translucida]